jgi:hypothetical protein
VSAAQRYDVALGIDPGKDGAVVVLARNLSIIQIAAVRLTKDLLAGVKGEYTPELMDGLIEELCGEHLVEIGVIERASVRPKEGPRSALTTGIGWGFWRMALAGRAKRTIVPIPTRWQEAVLADIPGGDDVKARAVARAAQIAGINLTPGRRRVPHTGIADAACMALYGLQQTRD